MSLPNSETPSAVRRTEQALCEQLSTWESSEYGVAFWSADFPDLASCNQLRDAWLSTVDAETAFERTEAFYTQKGLTCRRWTTAAGQTVEPVEALLASKGWRRIETTAWRLERWDAADGADPSIRVLPARAMKRAFQKTFEGATDAEQGAAVERLNDTNHEALVAMIDGKPVGRGAYLEVGDIARLTDVFVLPAHRRRGVGSALAAHFLRTARRLSPRVVVAACRSDDPGARTFLERCGFAPDGALVAFDRPR